MGWLATLCLMLIVRWPSGGLAGHASRPSYSHIPEEADIVFPYAVDELDRFLTHDVTSHHRRRRRDVTNNVVRPDSPLIIKISSHVNSGHVETNNNSPVFNNSINATLSHKIPVRKTSSSTVSDNNAQVNIGDTLTFHLHLHQTPTLLSPHFKIHRRRDVRHANGTTSKETVMEQMLPEEHCFYSGKTGNHNNSRAALSLCHGMTGFIHTGSKVYLIEPLLPHRWQHLSHTRWRQQLAKLPTEGGPIPHAMYMFKSQSTKENSKGSNGNICGQTNSGKTSVMEDTMKYSENLSYKPPKRHRRSAADDDDGDALTAVHGNGLNVELIVVVDNDMVKTHGEQNVTTYVLTILNMVAQLFHDNTIGTKINMTLAALILMEGQEPGFVVGHHADRSLTDFCRWQSTLEGAHHDHAILLTGVDICSYQDKPCDTLGFAPIKGMCKRHRSCTINEDTGLGTAFTIAHEAGHNLGMFHDGEGNFCRELAGSIMAPTIAGQDGVFTWSACSRKYLTRFLGSSQAGCLQDEAGQTSDLRFPEQLPGEIYNADVQCKWQFGPHATLCPYDFAKDVCKALWCFLGGVKCETKFLPAAEGTSCGPAKWCRKAVCVGYGQEGPAPVDGGWGPYSDWGPCSRTCGTGVRYKQRHCNHPRPQYGGKDCEGDTRVYQICNTDECPNGQPSFRSVQCAEHDGKEFRGWKYNWAPYGNIREKQDICRLYCQAVGYDFFFALDDKVVDGTPCEENSPDVCVEGVCMVVGCDGVVGEGAARDQCGLCGGDNTTCTRTAGTFSQTLKAHAYHPIVTLPRGSKNIVVRESESSPNYLAVRNASHHYYITGNWVVSWPGTYHIAGTDFRYSHPYDEPEELVADGPITESLTIELLAHGTKVDIEYEYIVPKSMGDSHHKPRHTYNWDVIATQCSATCAGGEQVRQVHCLRDEETEVDSSNCDSETRPTSGLVTCNTQPCPPRWEGREWSECSHTCGGGIRQRHVVCLQKLNDTEVVRLRNRNCRHLSRPPKREVCNEHDCPAEWRAGMWSMCSSTCGSGVRHRSVTCIQSHAKGARELEADACAHLNPPNTTESCDLGPCLQKIQWFISSWSKCSATCGSGFRSRTLRCSGLTAGGSYEPVGSEQCAHLPRPALPLIEACQLRKCRSNKPRWFVSAWSLCSVSCGEGRQSRLVKCLEEGQGQPTGGCDLDQRPAITRACQALPCDQTGLQGECEDKFPWCHGVVKYGLCRHQYYGGQCCQSCSDPDR